MHVPFSRNLDELFRGDKNLIGKMLGSAFAAAFVAVMTTLRGTRNGQLPMQISPTGFAIIGGIAGLIGALIALGLALKDYVRKKTIRDQPVNAILFLFFGGGIATLGAWVAMAFFVTFVTVMVMVQLGF